MKFKDIKLPIVALVVAILFFVPVTYSLLLSKSYNAATKTVSIHDLIFPVAEIQLISNTDQCLIDCEAVIRIRPSTNIQTPLFETDAFKWQFVGGTLQGYSFELLETIPYTINNYKDVCNNYNITENNGTLKFIENCTLAIESSYTAYRKEYMPFNFWGYTFEAGKDYYIKLKGKKHAAANIEWIPTFYGLRINEWAWWNSSWTRNRAVSIYNGNNTIMLLETHPVRMVFNTAAEIAQGDMRSDCGDIRILYNNQTELSHNVTDCNSATTLIHFSLAGKSISALTNDTSFNIYYGNSQAASKATNMTFVNSTAVISQTTALWHLNERAGASASDNESTSNTLNLNGNTWWDKGYTDSGIGLGGASGDYLSTPDQNDVDLSTTDFTVELWVKRNDSGAGTVDPLVYKWHADTPARWNAYIIRSTDKIDWFTHTSTSEHTLSSSSAIPAGAWTHIALRREGGTKCIFINGREDICASGAVSGDLDNSDPLEIGHTPPATHAMTGYVDDIRITKRALNTSEMHVLKPDPAAALGAEIVKDDPPSVTLQSPADNYVYTTSSVTFNCSAADDNGLRNLSLYTNTTGTWAIRQAVNITGISNSSTFALNNIADGIYAWNCLAQDTGNQSSFAASNRTFTVVIGAAIYNITYDANGNRISGFGYYFEYNNFNQLTRVRQNNATGTIIEEYTYDHSGDRIQKYEPQKNQTTYYFDKSFIRVVNSSGTFDSVYYYDEKDLVARRELSNNNKTFFYHPDHLGSTSLITNSTGQLVEETTYEPFGEVFSGGSDRFLYTGKELDPGTGLEYYGARYYDPSKASQFISPDSIISDIYNPQALNRYAYVLNNPYKYTDPSGNEADLIGRELSGAAGVVVNHDTGKVYVNGVYIGRYETKGVGVLGGGASYRPTWTHFPYANKKEDIEGLSHSFNAEATIVIVSINVKVGLPVKGGSYSAKQGYDLSQPSFSYGIGPGLGGKIQFSIMEETTTISEVNGIQSPSSYNTFSEDSARIDTSMRTETITSSQTNRDTNSQVSNSKASNTNILNSFVNAVKTFFGIG